MLRNTLDRWGSLAQSVHWLTVLLILGMLLSGFAVAEWISSKATEFTVLQWHKSFGILVLTLTALRLVWRGFNPTPKLPDTMKGYERSLAHITHWGLYFLLFAMPIVGWMIISTSTRNIPTVIFGLFTLPRIASPDREAHEFYEELHEVMAFVLIALAVFHILAALKHHIILKDDVLRRMTPRFLTKS
ncbi:MAG: cytochrome b [Sphingomonadales bacterium]|jgi:cytochrome b561